MNGSGDVALATASLAAVGAGMVGWVVTLRLFPSFSWKGPDAGSKPPKRHQWTRSQRILGLACLSALLTAVFIGVPWGAALLFLLLLGWYGSKKGPDFRKKWVYGIRRRKLSEVFPQSLGMAIQALKTGQTLPQALDYLSRESPSPLKEEWKLVCGEMDLGSSTEQALTKMAEKYPDFRELSGFLESYKVSRQTGANLAYLLEVLLEGLEEKNKILRKMEAMTAQARLSGWIMGMLPILLGTVFFCMDPDLILPLFTQKAGWGILGLALIMETIGFYWIRQLLRLEV